MLKCFAQKYIFVLFTYLSQAQFDGHDRREESQREAYLHRQKSVFKRVQKNWSASDTIDSLRFFMNEF